MCFVLLKLHYFSNFRALCDFQLNLAIFSKKLVISSEIWQYPLSGAKMALRKFGWRKNGIAQIWVWRKYVWRKFGFGANMSGAKMGRAKMAAQICLAQKCLQTQFHTAVG